MNPELEPYIARYLKKAHDAGLRSIRIGFSKESLRQHGVSEAAVIRRTTVLGGEFAYDESRYICSDPITVTHPDTLTEESFANSVGWVFVIELRQSAQSQDGPGMENGA